MDNYKILIHGHDATNIVASFELLYYQAVINYINGNVASFNRADVQVINKDGKDIAAPIKVGANKMQITKEHYIDRGELLSFDYDTQIKACSIFSVLSGGESKITEGTKKLSVEFVLSLEQECKKIVSKTRPATGE